MRTITATISPLVRATIVSTRPLTSEAGPVVTAGSGLARLGGWIFVAQDDSTSLAMIGDDGSTDAVRLFDPIDGADRFIDVLGNKRLKPDMEAIAIVHVSTEAASRLGAPARAGNAVLVFGSGSLQERRDHVALVFVETPFVRSEAVTIHARSLYERLRMVTGFVGEGQLNVEGAAVVDDGRTLRLFNRGIGGERGSTASVDIDALSLLDYLARARTNATAPFDSPVSNPIRYDLGLSDRGFPVSITDATVIAAHLPGAPKSIDGEIIVVSAVAEETTDATLDGVTSDTMLGLMIGGSMLIASLMEDGAPSSLKIEGLAVREAAWVSGVLRVRLVAITDPDATELATASVFVEISLECGADITPVAPVT